MPNEPANNNILKKAFQLVNTSLDNQLAKAKTPTKNDGIVDPEDLIFSKAVTEDQTYAIHSSGWKEKPHRLQFQHLKMMAQKDSVIAAILQTRQNQVSNYSRYTKSEQDKGWTLRLRDEDDLLEEIKEELKAKKLKSQAAKQEQFGIAGAASDPANPPTEAAGFDPKDTNLDGKVPATEATQEDDDTEKVDWELERKAKAILEKKFKKEKAKVRKFLLKCGVVESKSEDKPFHAKFWNLDSFLRVLVRDSLIYDIYATELVRHEDESLAYFIPIDASTVRFSSNRFSDYKAQAEQFSNLSLMYPTRESEAREESGVIDLKQNLVDIDAYKYVQVVNGKIERAYTEKELKIGIRNPTTDIYNNGYGISELEILVALVTGHLNAEYYNQAYFTQGFSAKGILHIKSAIPRRKLESIRQQWQATLKGSRNSFQTPIFAGVDDVNWIALTQNHEDIGFEGWLRYLIKMICAIYQIDPQEIGIGMKEEGGSGAGLGGDNTQEKIAHSKDKGLYPLLRHLENFINESILSELDDRFSFCFTGITSETKEEFQKRQAEEGKNKKTVNEIRVESDLPPLPGMDDVILDSTYMQWYTQFSEAGKANQQANAMMGGGQPGEGQGGGEEDQDFQDTDSFDPYSDSQPTNFDFDPENDQDIYGQDPQGYGSGVKLQKGKPIVKNRVKLKPLRIEYYQIAA